MAKMKNLDWIAIVLLIAGGLNWGLVSWFNFNLVETLSFGFSFISKTVYTLVALSALYSIKVFTLK